MLIDKAYFSFSSYLRIPVIYAILIALMSGRCRDYLRSGSNRVPSSEYFHTLVLTSQHNVEYLKKS
jgi:hypothetical protein